MVCYLCFDVRIYIGIQSKGVFKLIINRHHWSDFGISGWFDLAVTVGLCISIYERKGRTIRKEETK